jgi:hypothetical protein
MGALVRPRVGIAFLLIAFGVAGTVYPQTFLLSAPIGGYCEVDMVDLDSLTGDCDGTRVTFGNLDETLYYDPASNDLRQVGSLAISPAGISLVFNETRGPVTATVSASLQLGSITFDTGYQGAFAGSDGGTDYFRSTLAIPVTGSYDVSTGGLNYTGPLNYTLPIQTIETITWITPASVTYQAFSPNDSTGPGWWSGTGPFMSTATASNGFDVNLAGGLNDNLYYYNWQLSQLMLESVPEPSTLLLVTFGVLSLWFVRRRK